METKKNKPYSVDNEILVDMDGVLADQMGGVFDVIKREDGLELCHYDVKDYWFKNMAVAPERIIDIFRRDGFYRELDVITGAVHGVNRLRQNFDVKICTQPMKDAVNCEQEKRDWLAHHFDQELADTAIVTDDKLSVSGNILIEDNPHIGYGEWLPIIFNQPWNQDVDLPRMYGWGNLGVVYANL